ncbi:VanZ family protein [Chryseobacterium oryctis]|uniref:VanZ family protein n=1 Tax=Chryseobacterium oryctis TaxID=2952618 RepID=A0ABT3HSL1_9FLAO|nr:VanZ family protein [Chryseobacterium oryctis]MCW3162734.1 VanZ family protein [Chryseobacterium oryctis]
MKKYFAVLISVYALFLLYMMFFGSGREASDCFYLQLKPFKTIHIFFTDSKVQETDFIINIIGNVFVFSPFGWLGLCISKFNKFFPITLFFIILISIIELTQSYTGRGVADVDDVFLNTLGMIIGFVLFKYATWKNFANIKHHFELYDKKYKIQTS